MRQLQCIGWITAFWVCFFSLSSLAFAETGVSAQSALVMEMSSGRTLYQKDADTPMPVASTTKILTALTALEHGDITESVTVSPAAAAAEGSSMYLAAGETLPLEQLLYGLMLSSGNDAAVAIAEHFGSVEEFVAMMNQKAQALGAASTHFTNPNGLPDEAHYSTARDMAVITAAALQNPTFAQIVASKSHTVPGSETNQPRTLVNHNRLLNMYDGCIGVKTGFTKAAGRCLVSAASRGGMTLICVTLNAPDDWNDHMRLYDDLFAAYRLSPVICSGTLLDAIAVENSEVETLPVTAPRDFSYPLAAAEECTVTLTLSPPLSAPVHNAAESGSIHVMLNGKEITSMPLITVGEAKRCNVFENPDGIFHKITDFLRGLLSRSG